MLHKTRGIVLRSIKYGDSSIIVTIFTALFGVQTYIVKGIRSERSKEKKTGLFQPSVLLDLVVYQNPQKNMQHISQYQFAHLYQTTQESIVKNSIAIFSVEILLKLLPEQAVSADLFDFAFQFFLQLDGLETASVKNFPIYFIIRCSAYAGYAIAGEFSESTPYLNIKEGIFSANLPEINLYALNEEDSNTLFVLLQAQSINDLKSIQISNVSRKRIIEWYIYFLQLHTQHMGEIKSLSVLHSVLH